MIRVLHVDIARTVLPGHLVSIRRPVDVFVVCRIRGLRDVVETPVVVIMRNIVRLCWGPAWL